ncbi:radical SAM protein [Candidatus Saganbacteria bacterium]|uniref:Radical SAM protein n=1 Tax=Candidatus Saganbacteria bacterium TaxID=2575572 RepID=A0A9D6ULW3_UNCSA|nr:radical SAM protein [Candidatus Saganbacteria bacterium]
MISGKRGSGALFFSHCGLKCVYCQNYAISREACGREVEIEELARIMLNLQEQGVHNINLVSPTHSAPQIVGALTLARREGLKLPVVYNTGGFDSLELLKEIEGKIEIYMPDLKYFDEEKALKYSGAGNYVETAKAGIAEMFRQVGNIKFNNEGVAVAGVLVRHLVLPENLADSGKALDYLASISKDIWVSLMAQYSPQYRAAEFPELSRPLRRDEYQQVVDRAEKLGLHNAYVQGLSSRETYLPDFKKERPFGS